MLFFFFLLYLLFPQKAYAQIQEIQHVISTGQSLAQGAAGYPSLSKTQKYDNIMLSGGKPLSNLKDIENANFTPLIEGGEESISSGLANYVAKNSKDRKFQIEINANGWGGRSYSLIKIGTEPFTYNIKEVERSKYLAENEGKKYKVTAITLIHGEADDDLYRVGDTCPNYQKNLLELQKDYNSEIKKITGQSENIPLFTDQLSSYSSRAKSPCVTLAQLIASKVEPKKIILVGPKYFLTYQGDSPHLNNYGYRLLGEYYGKVYKKVIIDKKKWTPLSPSSITRKGRTITLDLFVPKPPIVIDFERVKKQKNFGFEFFSPNLEIGIKSVKIISPTKIEIKLDKLPKAKVEKLRYAYSAILGSSSGATPSGSPRGNIRDSDIGNSLYKTPLYNWLVHFDEPIKVLSEEETIQEKSESFITNFEEKIGFKLFN